MGIKNNHELNVIDVDTQAPKMIKTKNLLLSAFIFLVPIFFEELDSTYSIAECLFLSAAPFLFDFSIFKGLPSFCSLFQLVIVLKIFFVGEIECRYPFEQPFFKYNCYFIV